MFYYRQGGSGAGDGMIHEYQGSSGQWTSGMGKFISRSGSYSGAVSSNSTTRNPYNAATKQRRVFTDQTGIACTKHDAP